MQSAGKFRGIGRWDRGAGVGTHVTGVVTTRASRAHPRLLGSSKTLPFYSAPHLQHRIALFLRRTPRLQGGIALPLGGAPRFRVRGPVSHRAAHLQNGMTLWAHRESPLPVRGPAVLSEARRPGGPVDMPPILLSGALGIEPQLRTALGVPVLLPPLRHGRSVPLWKIKVGIPFQSRHSPGSPPSTATRTTSSPSAPSALAQETGTSARDCP